MIRKIQSMYRAKRARALMKQLIKANYVKEYDEETGYFFYRNKRTGEVREGWTEGWAGGWSEVTARAISNILSSRFARNPPGSAHETRCLGLG